MTADTLKKANELRKEIERLEDFMFWCSGMRDGFRFYPAAIVKIKRKWCSGIEAKEYAMSTRLQEKVGQCVEEELELLKQELNKM